MLTSHRKSMDPARAKKAVFVLSNYNLLQRGVEMGDTLSDFEGSLLVDEVTADELRGKRLHALRRGRLITDEELEADGDEAAGNESNEDEGEAAADDSDGAATAEETAARREVKWHLPEGLEVVEKPYDLDDSLTTRLWAT